MNFIKNSRVILILAENAHNYDLEINDKQRGIKMIKRFCDKCEKEIKKFDDVMECSTKGIGKIRITIDTENPKRNNVAMIDFNHEYLFCGDCAILIKKAICDCIKDKKND